MNCCAGNIIVYKEDSKGLLNLQDSVPPVAAKGWPFRCAGGLQREVRDLPIRMPLCVLVLPRTGDGDLAVPPCLGVAFEECSLADIERGKGPLARLSELGYTVPPKLRWFRKLARELPDWDFSIVRKNIAFFAVVFAFALLGYFAIPVLVLFFGAWWFLGRTTWSVTPSTIRVTRGFGSQVFRDTRSLLWLEKQWDGLWEATLLDAHTGKVQSQIEVTRRQLVFLAAAWRCSRGRLAGSEETREERC